MLLSRSIASTVALRATLGSATFPEQSELGSPGAVTVHGGGGGGGAGDVGVEFTSLAHTGMAMASASRIVANVFRQLFIGGLPQRDVLRFSLPVRLGRSEIGSAGRANHTRPSILLQESLHMRTKDTHSCTYMTQLL